MDQVTDVRMEGQRYVMMVQTKTMKSNGHLGHLQSQLNHPFIHGMGLSLGLS